MIEIYKEKLKKIKPKTHKQMEDSFEDRAIFPSLYLNSEQLSEIKDWKVGEEYMLVLKVKQTSMSERDDKISADFDILEVGVGEMEDSGKEDDETE